MLNQDYSNGGLRSESGPFIENDKGKLMDFWRHSVTPQRLECKTARRKT